MSLNVVCCDDLLDRRFLFSGISGEDLLLREHGNGCDEVVEVDAVGSDGVSDVVAAENLVLRKVCVRDVCCTSGEEMEMRSAAYLDGPRL